MIHTCVLVSLQRFESFNHFFTFSVTSWFTFILQLLFPHFKFSIFTESCIYATATCIPSEVASSQEDWEFFFCQLHIMCIHVLPGNEGLSSGSCKERKIPVITSDITPGDRIVINNPLDNVSVKWNFYLFLLLNKYYIWVD